MFIDVVRLLYHDFLTRRLGLRDFLRRHRLRKRPRQLLCALLVVRPAEHGVDHFDVAKQVGYDLVVRLAFDVGEDNRTAAVHQLLQAGDLEVGIHLLVRLDQIATRAEPGERAAEVPEVGQCTGCCRYILGANAHRHCPFLFAGLFARISKKTRRPERRRLASGTGQRSWTIWSSFKCLPKCATAAGIFE